MPEPRYCTRSRGPTIASALNATAGAAIRVTVCSAWVIACTSGWFWQDVPIRFHRKAMASSRSTSTPRLASHRMISANSASTEGFAQLRSHCHWLNVVQTQASRSGSWVKLPGANSGKTSGSVRS